MKSFSGKKCLVYGMGVSGKSVCRLLHNLAVCVSVYDDNPKFSDIFCFEKNPLEKKYDFIVVSPGVKVIDNPLIQHFQLNKTPIVSELDLGFSFLKGKLIAVTGTNGKTTICTLLCDIFKKAEKEVFVCGNIGLPLCSVVEKTTKKGITVCEVSSFQLELSQIFNPDIALISNLSEDHIDRHENFAEYVKMKNKICQNFKNQTLVLNQDDKNSKLITQPKNVGFFSRFPQKKGAYVKDGIIYFNKSKIMEVDEIGLLGEKNLENVLACVYVAMTWKISPKIIKDAVCEFLPPPHRVELFAKINKVSFYDDSKSTNPSCVQSALMCLKEKRVILLMGGVNKNFSFDGVFKDCSNIVKILAFGESREEISLSCEKAGLECLMFNKMQEAVEFSLTVCKAGDCVLLSPGCASFDEFSSYKERGQLFKKIVRGE